MSIQTGPEQQVGHHSPIEGLEHALLSQHARVVRWCAQWTRDADAAEDLAQETLLEAWRNTHKLRDRTAHQAWLRGIARNVCLRWLQRHSREHTHLPLSHTDEQTTTHGITNQPVDDFDLEVELERSELIELLDRALALLPPDTRTVLIQSYVEDFPHAEIAARLGLTENAVAVRIHRGKLALRRILTTDLKEEAVAYGLVDGTAAAWQETRIWCPTCGQRRLLGRFTDDRHEFYLRCPDCLEGLVTCIEQGDFNTNYPGFLHGIKGYKAALSRILRLSHEFHRRALTSPILECGCGAHVPVSFDHEQLTVGMACPVCGTACKSTPIDLVLALPEGQRFWRKHPKIRMLLTSEAEASGRPAVVTRLQSITGAARMDVVLARDNFEVLGIHSIP